MNTDQPHNPHLARCIVLASPFAIITINLLVAIVGGSLIGKWAFIPIIVVEWLMFTFLIVKYGRPGGFKVWMQRPKSGRVWAFACLVIAILPLPIFQKHHGLLVDWQLWLPWIVLALINPFLEEFYWRGLLMDYTKNWNGALSIFCTAALFSVNHAVFGVNSELFRGVEVIISTFVMGLVWALTYKRSNSLIWVIASHFVVDFLNLSAPSFLDLYKAGW